MQHSARVDTPLKAEGPPIEAEKPPAETEEPTEADVTASEVEAETQLRLEELAAENDVHPQKIAGWETEGCFHFKLPLSDALRKYI